MNSYFGLNSDFCREMGAKLNPVFFFTRMRKDSSLEKNSSSSSNGIVNKTILYSRNCSRKAPRYFAAAATAEP